MNRLFRRKILERIDYFNYINPDIFYDDKKDNDKNKNKTSKKVSKEKTYRKGNKHLSKKQAKDIRKYMQYSNAISE